MKKLLMVMITACLLVSMALVGASSSTSAKEKAPYKFGFCLDLTGALSYMGIPLKEGADWALEKVNAAGGVNGRKIEIVYYDGKTDSAEVVKAAKKMIDVDKVISVCGIVLVANVLAAYETCANAGVVDFASCPVCLTGEPTSPWLFTVCGDQKVGSIPLLVQNLVDRGSKKIAYVYLNITYGQTGLKVFKEAMAERGLTPIATENYAWGTTDFAPQVTHIKASGADGLLITGLVQDTVSFIKTARDLGIDYPIVSDYAVPGPEFLELGGKYVEGIVSTGPRALVAPDLPDDDPFKALSKEIYDWYTAKHGTMTVFCTHLVDQVNILTLAMKKVDPNLDPTKKDDLAEIRKQFRDSLETVKGYYGLHGSANYSPTNHSGRDVGCYVRMVPKDGVWRLLETVEAEDGPIDTWAYK